MNSNASPYQTAMDQAHLSLERLSKTLGPPDPQLQEQLEKALALRFQNNQSETILNTYLKSFEISQIKLFDILANHFPLVVESQRIAHNCLISQLNNHHRLCIVDLGIGRCVQMLKLLDLLNHLPNLNEVVLLGVDITPEALAFTDQVLKEKKNLFCFAFSFRLFQSALESMDFSKLKSLIPKNSDFVYVNSSLTLHHIQGNDERNSLFKKIKTLSPDLMTLIEPNASTFTDDFEVRMNRAIEHFYALYNYTDTLPLTNKEKRSLKTFFGNDFFDPIAYPENARFEKLERGEEWMERASRAGFHPFTNAESVKAIEIENIDVVTAPDPYVSFGYKGIDLLSLIHFK